MKIKCAGIVLYNPNIERLIENYNSISNQVDIVILIDNNSINITDIRSVFSTMDNVMIIENKKNLGTIPIISNYDLVEMCFDKYKFYKFLIKNGLKTIRSYVDKEMFYKDIDAGLIEYPVFVKPVRGSASININKVTTKEEIELLFNRYDNLMIQEFIDGIEYGVDAYIDMISSEPVAIFTKKKIKMRAGETDKSVSIKDENLFNLIKKFFKFAEFKGIIDIDIFKVNGEYYISEVNPRFGGGYPHAYECGVNVPRMIINNLEGKVNQDVTGQYDEDIYMMKFNEVKIYSYKENRNGEK
jgi:carbamoyl-phosphate synthase large subunit